MIISKNEIAEIISLHEKMKNSYYWTPPRNAAYRRWYEEKNSVKIKGLYMRCPVSLECSTSCSCKNIYYRGSFYIDGKKVTIASVKKLIA